jgi:hypothetical protein
MTVATAKDSMTATREALSEMIYYYMERSFPPLAVPKVEDIHLVDDFSISDLIKEVIQQLKMNQLQPQYGFPEFSSIEDYLSKELVCKLEITGSNESSHKILLIGALCSYYFFCHYIFCEGYVIYIHDIFYQQIFVSTTLQKQQTILFIKRRKLIFRSGFNVHRRMKS